MIGSAAMASVYVASGKADLYMENKSYLWDVAAGAAIVNAAGGKALILNHSVNPELRFCFVFASLFASPKPSKTKPLSDASQNASFVTDADGK